MNLLIAIITSLCKSENQVVPSRRKRYQDVAISGNQENEEMASNKGPRGGMIFPYVEAVALHNKPNIGPTSRTANSYTTAQQSRYDTRVPPSSNVYHPPISILLSSTQYPRFFSVTTKSPLHKDIGLWGGCQSACIRERL